MIDDRLRTAAHELRREGEVGEAPDPEFGVHGHGGRLALAMSLALAGAAFWAVAARNTSGDNVAGAASAAPVAPTSWMPTVPTSTASTDPEVVTTSIEPAPAGSTEAPASTGHTPTTHPPTGEFPRLDFPGFLEWIGRSTVPVPEGEYDLGSTGSVNWTLHVSPERVCLHQSAPFGGNCTGVDDGSLPAGSFVKRGGTDAHDGRWTRFQVAPIGVDIRFVIGDVAACDMHALAVPAPSDLVVWACEGSGDTPQPLDVVATRDGEAVQSPMS